MMIDSHAHYTNSCYKKPFRYLTRTEDGYALAVGDREQLLKEMQAANIPYAIEPGVSLASCGDILEFCRQFPNIHRQTGGL